MKKLIFILSLSFFTITLTQAQTLQYGLQAGLGFATQSLVNPDIFSTGSVTTYYLRAVVDIPLKHEFYIQTGLGVVGKGVKEYQNAQTNTITLTYLDLPVDILYKFPLRTLGKVYVGLGPYASAGLSGNNQLENINITQGTSVVFGGSDDYQRMDYGVNAVGGLELSNHLTLNLKYSFGINNIVSDNIYQNDPNTTSVKNRVFSIGLGFLL